MRLAPFLLLTAAGLGAAEPWSVEAYPDEAGFRARSAGLIERLARTPNIVTRGMSAATCPDTGRRFHTWALEGEEIHSPFTGRRFVQGDTGYFGPKQRDAEGRISHFGGDPLKFALPPATARLLQTPDFSAPVSRDDVVAYLSIPGNLRQQYHFAASNWARFLPLAGDQMSAAWHEAFREAVATYAESRRPSDGAREHAPMPNPLNLVGDPAEHLGGGGTENHKVMFRTTALLYSQWFPEGSRISGHSLEDARRIAGGVLEDFSRKLFTLGNGEYQSTIYFPHSIQPLLNLHDFSPDPSTRAMAKAALDYYLAVYALKTFNGVHTGAKRRGWVDGSVLGEKDTMLWLWAGGQPGYTTARVDLDRAHVSLHQLTSTYRPNPALLALAAKRVPLPFEAELAYPDYHMGTRARHVETFYASHHYALGSVQVDGVNNSAQQTTWSLNVRGKDGSMIFGGGQPRWLSPGGHSPYDQWVQKRGALLFVSGSTERVDGQPEPQPYVPGSLEGARGYTRQAAFAGARTPAVPPTAQDEAGLRTYFAQAHDDAATWLWVPRRATVHERGGRYIVEAPDAWVVVSPLRPRAFWIDPPDRRWLERPGLSGPLSQLREYRILVLPGETSGFAIEAIERADFPSLARIERAGRLRLEGLTATYRSLAGDELVLRYQPTELRPAARINGTALDWTRWADGGHISGGPLTIKDGRMTLRTDAASYEFDYTSRQPQWRPLGQW
jgi:hypothetical protein